MTEKDFFIQIINEYFSNAIARYEYELKVVKNNIILHGYDADSLYDLILCEARLDTARAEFRKIRQIIDIYF